MIPIALSIGVLLVAIVLFSNILRAKKDLHLNGLRPNCLLTKHAIVFITGKRSIFYFLKYWNNVPKILSEHGYEVQVLNLPWRDAKTRRKHLLHFLQESKKAGKAYHFLGDITSFKELKWLEALESTEVASLSLVDDYRIRSKKLTPEDLNPRSGQITRFVWKSSEKDHKQKSQHSFSTLFAKLHSLWTGSLDEFSAHTLGATRASEQPNFKDFYIDIAISLAEYDMQCFHITNESTKSI